MCFFSLINMLYNILQFLSLKPRPRKEFSDTLLVLILGSKSWYWSWVDLIGFPFYIQEFGGHWMYTADILINNRGFNIFEKEMKEKFIWWNIFCWLNTNTPNSHQWFHENSHACEKTHFQEHFYVNLWVLYAWTSSLL